MSTSTADIIAHTKNWITDVVIGCNFCPFAGKAFRSDSIHYQVQESNEPALVLERLIRECIRLDENETIETTLLIFPNPFKNFNAFLDMDDLANQAMKKEGYEGIYQLASFHPNYLFAGSKENDAANYTNRSVYAMLHLLREDSVEKALADFPHPEKIPERNIGFCKTKGLEFMKGLREQCLEKR